MNDNMNITRVMPNKWSYSRKRRTARRMRALRMPESVIKDRVWANW